MTQSDNLFDGKAIHPLAALFPPMTEDEFAASGIRTRGLQGGGQAFL